MQIANLQIAPTGIRPVINASQFDSGRQFQLVLYDGATAYSLPAGTTARIDGIKPDKKGFQYTDAVSVSGNVITVTTKDQMTVVQGDVQCEIRLLNGNNNIGTLNFILKVEASPINEDTDISETVLPDVIDAAESHALLSEGYAVGEQGGVPVTSESPYYHNNAKYYKEEAGTSAETAVDAATDAVADSLKAEGYAIGKQDGVPVEEGSDYYHNNAKYYSDRAESFTTNVPYIGANGHWWIWNVTDDEYVDSGIDASITVQIADITMLDASATPYVTNTGTDTDPIFHLFIPRGLTGKTAYEAAVEGGYQDTEAHFEADLANFSEWASNTETNAANARQAAIDAKADADRAEMYADFVTPHFIIANNRLYIKDDAVGEFVVANNRLYIKLAS